VLEQLLPAQLYTLFAVFVRMGSAFTLLPGIAEAFVTMRFRLMLAAAASLVITPVVGSSVPPLPATVPELFLLLGGEIVVGVFIGLSARVVLSAVQTAGMIIGLQTSLANAFAYDPSVAQQGAVTGAWMSTIALVLIFVSDLHHLMLRALVDSYTLFPAGAPPPVGDFADATTRLVAASFRLGTQIAAPFIAFGFIFLLAQGLIARLMPQVHVYFVALPLQIVVGFLALAATIAAGMAAFLAEFEATIAAFITSR
jgi:flagellar biosynthetic protein FliR